MFVPRLSKRRGEDVFLTRAYTHILRWCGGDYDVGPRATLAACWPLLPLLLLFLLLLRLLLLLLPPLTGVRRIVCHKFKMLPYFTSPLSCLI